MLAVDSDPGETLTVAVAEGPPGMTVDAQNIVRWTPDGSDLGQHVIVVDAVDSLGARASQNYVLEVVAPVTVPDLSGLTEAQAVAALRRPRWRPARFWILQRYRARGRSGHTGSDRRRDHRRRRRCRGRDLARPGAGDRARCHRPDRGRRDGRYRLSRPDTGAVSFVNDPNMPRGAVLTQDPPPRSQAAPGASVDLVVSGGPRA